MTDKEPTKIDLNIAEIQSNFKVIIKTLEVISIFLIIIIIIELLRLIK